MSSLLYADDALPQDVIDRLISSISLHSSRNSGFDRIIIRTQIGNVVNSNDYPDFVAKGTPSNTKLYPVRMFFKSRRYPNRIIYSHSDYFFLQDPFGDWRQLTTVQSEQDPPPKDGESIDDSELAPEPVGPGAVGGLTDSVEQSQQAEIDGQRARRGEPSLDPLRKQTQRFVIQYILASASNDPTAQSKFFAPVVSFYDQSGVTREQILETLAKFDDQWPVRTLGTQEMAGASAFLGENNFRVTQCYNWTIAKEGRKQLSGGTSYVECVVHVDPEKMEITSITEREDGQTHAIKRFTVDRDASTAAATPTPKTTSPPFAISQTPPRRSEGSSAPPQPDQSVQEGEARPITYVGHVGQLDAIFFLKWMPGGKIQGTYFYPKRGINRSYTLLGENSEDGKIYLEEYTDKALTARIGLVKSINSREIVWEGAMQNVDGRRFEMSFRRDR
jgi:hypothetical protein